MVKLVKVTLRMALVVDKERLKETVDRIRGI